MNFLKKKLKPLTSGLTTNIASHHNKQDKSEKDLEDDLYDEYVVEAPPHPSELLALGIDPSEIDANNPDKLRELYKKAKEEGKDKKTNSVLLARQRQKEEIEEKKKTREEWKFFDSITARVEQAVKESQKTLEHLKESSAVDKLTEPEYELRLSADEVFKSSASVKQEKGPDNWIDFNDDDQQSDKKKEQKGDKSQGEAERGSSEILDGYSGSRKRSSVVIPPDHIVEELLEDFGFDLRPKQNKLISASGSGDIRGNTGESNLKQEVSQEARPIKLDIDIRTAARPRPRPNSATNKEQREVDPFDTSFVTAPVDQNLFEPESHAVIDAVENAKEGSLLPSRAPDPFDTSFVNL